jgi:hypothetical protein
VVPSRFWTATEIAAAIRLACGFTIVASYGDFDETTAVDAPEAWRLILILRRDQCRWGRHLVALRRQFPLLALFAEKSSSKMLINGTNRIPKVPVVEFTGRRQLQKQKG